MALAARPAYTRLAAPSRRELFDRILERSGRRWGGAPPVVVFDLDGTLLDNRPRTLAILRELADAWATDEPDVAARIRGAELTRLAYHVAETLERLGVHSGTHGEDTVVRAVEFWKERFFNDPHLRHDVEVPGAAAFARACHDRGATLVYLTGRDLPMMATGTLASLRDLGFPVGVAGTELVLKPRADMPDGDFKRFEAPRLPRVGAVVAAFDNEPENCNIFAEHFPDADTVFVDTQHLDGAPALAAGVRVIGDFAGDG